jgi:hypothetical protein
MAATWRSYCVLNSKTEGDKSQHGDRALNMLDLRATVVCNLASCEPVHTLAHSALLQNL